MRVYLAASFNARPQMRDLRDQLVAKGYTVTSRWLDTEVSDDDPRALWLQAHEDLVDIEDAELVAVFTQPDSTTGGMHVEHGYALAMLKTVAIVGPIRNLFQTWTANTFQHFPDIPSWLASLPDRSTPLALVEESYR